MPSSVQSYVAGASDAPINNTVGPNTKKPNQGKPGVEDGEIEDEKRQDPVDESSGGKAIGNEQVKSDTAPPMTDAGSNANELVSAEPKNSTREAGAPAPTTQSRDSRPPSSDMKATASPGPSRPQAPRTYSDAAVESRMPSNVPNHPEIVASRNSDVRRPDNISESLSREASTNRQLLDPAQEAIRERLNRNQPRRDEGTMGDSTATNLRSNHYDGNDTRRLQNGVDVRTSTHYPAAVPMQNNVLGSQRARPLNHQQDFSRRPGEPKHPQPSTSMPPPQAYVAQHHDSQIPNSRAALTTRAQGPGQNKVEQRPAPGRADQSSYYGRQSREASPHRYDTRRPRPGDDYASQESSYLSNERHRAQMGRHHQQPFPQEHHASHSGPLGQIDGSRDFRSGPLDSEPRQYPRRSDMPQAYPDRQDPQYGRLNSSTDAPAGPRATNANQPPLRNTRSASMTQPYGNGVPSSSPRQIHAPTAPHERQTPTGPSSGRPPTRSGGPPPRPEPIATQNPPASDAPDTAGVHPDRLKAIQELSASPTEPSNHRQSNQVDATRGMAPPGSVPTAVPPRGPSGPGQSPTGPTHNGRGPPNGPAFAASRSDKRFVGIQGVLQQSAGSAAQDKSSQGTSIRGRGARTRNTEPSPVSSGPPTPISRPEVLPREDLFAGRNTTQDLAPVAEDDQRYGRGRRRPDARDTHRGDHARIDRQRSRSLPRDQPSRFPPHEGEGRPFRRDDWRQEPPLPPPEHELRRSTRGADERRMPPERREGSNWNNPRGGAPPERRDDRDRRDGGGSARKRFRPGDEGPPERAQNHGDKRPRRIQ